MADMNSIPLPRRGEKIRKISASQQIHAALRERILKLELKPGQNLSRMEIAEFYGVSQTPVRDAMLRLEEEGLLFIYPQSKTEVSKIDIAHARETQLLRLALEIEVSYQLIEHPTSGALDEATAALEQQVIASDRGDLDRFSEFDRAFHRSMFNAAGVPALWNLITERSGHIDRLRKLNLPDPGKAAEILGYHERILAGIRAADKNRVASELRAHLSGTLARVEAIAKRYPEYF